MKVKVKCLFGGKETVAYKEKFYHKVNLIDETGKSFQTETDNPNVTGELKQLTNVDCEIDIVQGKYPKFKLISIKGV